MTKLGALIGFVVGFLRVFVVGDQIDVLADKNGTFADFVATAVAVAVGVGGGVLGARVAGRLKARTAAPRSVAP